MKSKTLIIVIIICLCMSLLFVMYRDKENTYIEGPDEDTEKNVLEEKVVSTDESLKNRPEEEQKDNKSNVSQIKKPSDPKTKDTSTKQNTEKNNDKNKNEYVEEIKEKWLR